MTTALYRRYRPEAFAEVIGQEHVTGPLMQALRSGRVNHAYLFSGPRGCGKTTSARILARTLNCHANTPETPVDTPCGQCPSCVELARGGSGSLDVVEIDAASHGGVDDARDLRERATFAPTRDRYKIFIIDEAHMVSPAGFNALLKIVEEPPPHIKFVFATTEPDKVIGTIRSRTHHYPFRLVPPDVLGPYLETLCAAEHVTLGGGVVPLVIRAGGGSVRDSLSVLDQLIAGSSEGMVDYDLAVGLLGFTHASLLDDVVDALAATDGASLFRVVDQLIASGHAPQRFVDDLLERLRDLIVIAVSGDAAGAVLRGQPADQLERMGAQAGRLGIARLSRAADLVNAALSEMTGATSPRLHLELLCARLLLPGADEGEAGLAARVDRLERVGIAAVPAGAGHRTVPPGRDARSAAGGLSGIAAVRAAMKTTGAAPEQPDDVALHPVAAAVVTEGAGGGTGGVAGVGAADPGRPAAAATRTQDGPSDRDAEAPHTGVTRRADAAPTPGEPTESTRRAAEPMPGEPAEPMPVEPVPVESVPDEFVPDEFVPVASVSVEAVPVEPAQDVPVERPVQADPTGATAEMVRRRWSEVLANIASPGARAFLGEHAQVMGLANGVLTLGFPPSVVAQARRGRPETISNAVYETLGVAATVEIVPADGATAARPRDAAPQRRSHDSPDPDEPAPASPRDPGPLRPPEPIAFDEADAAWLAGAALSEPDDESVPPEDDGSPLGLPPAPEPSDDALAPVAGAATERAQHTAPEPASTSVAPGSPPRERRRESAVEAVRRHALQARGRGTAQAAPSASGPDPYDDAATDDPDIATTGLVGVPLVVKLLNGTVIDEQVDHS